ncbi:MAG: Sec-independent protein translocase protein TatB [Nautiliaceae bacterium]
MLDIGFPEFTFIVIIAIIVLGPDKLPEALKATGKMVGKVKRMWRDATADIRRELELEEMKEEMQKYKEELKKLQEQVNKDTSEINKGLTSLDDLTAMGNTRSFKDMIK